MYKLEKFKNTLVNCKSRLINSKITINNYNTVKWDYFDSFNTMCQKDKNNTDLNDEFKG